MSITIHTDAHLLIINDADEQLAVAGLLASTDRQFIYTSCSPLLFCTTSIMSISVFLLNMIFAFSCFTSELSFQTRNFVFLFAINGKPRSSTTTDYITILCFSAVAELLVYSV